MEGDQIFYYHLIRATVVLLYRSLTPATALTLTKLNTAEVSNIQASYAHIHKALIMPCQQQLDQRTRST